MQTWTANVSNVGKTTDSMDDDYTKITFRLDFKRFNMDGIDDYFEILAKWRVYDLAGTSKGVEVYLNGTFIEINNFKEYTRMYTSRSRDVEPGDPSPTTLLVGNPNPDWEIGFAVSNGFFQQVSFVNSIATTSGGTHVSHISGQIITKLMNAANKKYGKGSSLKRNDSRSSEAMQAAVR